MKQQGGKENIVRCDMVSERKTPGDSAFCHCRYLCFFLPAALWLNRPIFCKVTCSRRLKSAGMLRHIEWQMTTGVSRIVVSLSSRVKQSAVGLLDPADEDTGNVGMYLPLKTM